MSLPSVRSLLASILVITTTAVLASPGAVLGVAIAKGSFHVDHARVSGNSTVFDGTSISTENSSSRIHLNNGARMALGPDSSATVTSARLLLEKGSGELQTAGKYQIEARTLRIVPAAPAAIARVLIEPDRQVRVEAVDGGVDVFNHSGRLVAKVNPGRALRFQPQAGPENSFQMTGCLLRKKGKFVLVDVATNQVVELRGMDVTEHLCNRVEVSGTALPGATPVEGAAQVIQVQKITPSALAGCLAAAAQVAADPCRAAPPPGTVAAPEPASHKGVYVGVAVAAAGGIGAAVALATRKTSK